MDFSRGGALAGLIAKAIIPRRAPGEFIVTNLLGIAGAVIAGFIDRAIGWYGPKDSGAGFIAAIVGALIILAVYRLIAGGRQSV